MACFLLITPLAAISGWLCLRGAQDHLQLKSRLEAVGLIALTIALFTIYILWTLVTKIYLWHLCTFVEAVGQNIWHLLTHRLLVCIFLLVPHRFDKQMCTGTQTQY